MKRYCKNIKFDKNRIMSAMLECLSDKWKRYDVARFLAAYQGMHERIVYRAIRENREGVKTLLDKAAEGLAREIKERDVHFPKIRYSVRYDGNSGKLREIGVESIESKIHNGTASGQLAAA